LGAGALCCDNGPPCQGLRGLGARRAGGRDCRMGNWPIAADALFCWQALLDWTGTGTGTGTGPGRMVLAVGTGLMMGASFVS